MYIYVYGLKDKLIICDNDMFLLRGNYINLLRYLIIITDIFLNSYVDWAHQ